MATPVPEGSTVASQPAMPPEGLQPEETPEAVAPSRGALAGQRVGSMQEVLEASAVPLVLVVLGHPMLGN
jgi:hypothetical protein